MVEWKSPGVKWQTTCRALTARSGKRDAPPMACATIPLCFAPTTLSLAKVLARHGGYDYVG